ncbi:hypothetical protein Hanom_Chr08g00696691 [Helianthus anomalus]
MGILSGVHSADSLGPGIEALDVTEDLTYVSRRLGIRNTDLGVAAQCRSVKWGHRRCPFHPKKLLFCKWASTINLSYSHEKKALLKVVKRR